ncbi:MAG: hypothetical protein QXT77_05125 [Candidatus Methanomethylicaceae archaeon]
MTCYYPISGWKAKNKNPTGKRSIVFNPRDGYADMPVELPCGKCTGCRADQALMWSIRAYHESTLRDQNSFITLTYDDEHLPKDGLIDKKHLQDFFKRLRRDLPPKSVRYIACGEYGDTTRRPHYHAILFGLDFLHDKVTIDENLYTSPTLERFWGQGHVSIAPVTMASICYVCGYVMKKINDEDTFNLMSRRPGIGADWLNKYKSDLVRTGSVTIEGREYPVPKRYLDWAESDFEELKKQRLAFARSGDALDKRGALRNREKNRKAKLKGRQEKL